MKKLVSYALVVVLLGINLPGFDAGIVLGASNNFSAEIISSDSPKPAKSGDSVNFVLNIKNTGIQTWSNSGENAVKLGTIQPRDHPGIFYHDSWLKQDRAATMAEATVAPGEIGRFEFLATAAGNGGAITEHFGLVAEGIAWFGDVDIPLTIDVQPAVYKASYVKQSDVALILKAGEVVDVSVTFQNIGDVDWLADGVTAVKVGTAEPRDRLSSFYHSSWLSDNRLTSASATVSPGGEGVFDFTLQAPQKVGNYHEVFGLVAEGITWFDVSFDLNIEVIPAVYQSELVARSDVNVSVAPGDTVEIWAEYKNTGNTVWSSMGENAVKLGTANPLDRTSNFRADTWLSNNRAATISPSAVGPGETARFTLLIKAPDEIGNYQEYFRPVVELITWLSAEDLHWNISVEEELVLTDALRVGITSTTENIAVQGASFVVRRGSDKGLVRKFINQSVTISPMANGYALNTGEQVKDYLRIIPLNDSVLTVQTSGIGYTYNTFRGIIEIRRSGYSGNVWVVNILELEDYMRGVAEVPDSWPTEAQKAQMVAARTFAASKRIAPRADIFDIYDDTRDQVYYGYNYEIKKPNLAAAAVATQGIVIKYQGQPIKAYFFSDSGGHTENVENVWGKGNPAAAIAYLKGVEDPYAKPINWQYTLTQDYLLDRFDNALGIAAESSDIIDKIEVAEKFASGRAKTIVFTMRSGRQISVPFYTFDYLTSNNEIRSMKFDVQTVGYVDSPDFQFTGQGWGHGVGLAQWGARNMADAGFKYDEILKYYYTDVIVGPLQ